MTGDCVMKFIVYGPPRGKSRPRANVVPTTNKYYVNMYTDSKTTSYEQSVAYSFYEQIGSVPPTDKNLKISITAVFPIPKSQPKRIKEQMLAGQIYPNKKPDIDNIIKIVLDGLNKVLYQDDKQVIELSAKKQYGETPCVIVEYETF